MQLGASDERWRQATTSFSEIMSMSSESEFVRAMLAKWLEDLERAPRDVELLVAVGSAYGKLHEYTHAATFYTRAVSVNPLHADAHLGLAAAYGHLGLPELKVDSCLRALSIEPARRDALANLGSALTKLARFEEATAAFERALEYGDANPDTRLGLGLAYAARGQTDDARRQVELLSDLGAPQAEELRQVLERLASARGSPKER